MKDTEMGTSTPGRHPLGHRAVGVRTPSNRLGSARGLVLVDWTSDLGNVPEDRPVRRATGFRHALASTGRVAVRC